MATLIHTDYTFLRQKRYWCTQCVRVSRPLVECDHLIRLVPLAVPVSPVPSITLNHCCCTTFRDWQLLLSDTCQSLCTQGNMSDSWTVLCQHVIVYSCAICRNLWWRWRTTSQGRTFLDQAILNIISMQPANYLLINNADIISGILGLDNTK